MTKYNGVFGVENKWHMLVVVYMLVSTYLTILVFIGRYRYEIICWKMLAISYFIFIQQTLMILSQLAQS